MRTRGRSEDDYIELFSLSNFISVLAIETAPRFVWQAPFTHWAILLAPLVVALIVRALHVIWMLASSEGCAVKPRRPASPALQREVWMVSKCCMEAAAYLGVEIKKGMWFGGDGEWVAGAWWSWDPVNGICELCLCPLRMPVGFLWLCYAAVCFLSLFLPMGCDFCIYTLLFVETCFLGALGLEQQ